MVSLKSIILASTIPLYLASCGGADDVSGLYQFTKKTAKVEQPYAGRVKNSDIEEYRSSAFASSEVTESGPDLMHVLDAGDGKIVLSEPDSHTYDLDGGSFCDQWSEEGGFWNSNYIACGTIGSGSLDLDVVEKINSGIFNIDENLVHAYTGRMVSQFE